MLAAKQDSELLFFQCFLQHSINGDVSYLEIVTPIILEAVRFAKREIKITQLERSNLSIKLKIAEYPKATEITKDNLMLGHLLLYLENTPTNKGDNT